MKTFVFIFADGPKVRTFPTTYDGFSAIIDAFNMYEEYFVGARYDSDKGNYVNILNAEAYLREIHPVKEYIEIACASGFDDSQIIKQANEMFGVKVSEIPSSWKQHMKEYMEQLEEYMISHPIG